MGDYVFPDPLLRIAEACERIADALENIAAQHAGTPELQSIDKRIADLIAELDHDIMDNQ